MSPLPDPDGRIALPFSDEALKRELERDGEQNALDAESILARARANAELVAAVENAVKVALTVGGTILAKALVSALADEALARR